MNIYLKLFVIAFVVLFAYTCTLQREYDYYRDQVFYLQSKSSYQTEKIRDLKAVLERFERAKELKAI